MQKAIKFEEILPAIDFNTPVSSTDKFYVDFNKVRGEFEEKRIYRALNVNYETKKYNDVNIIKRPLIFLAGMRGSGKTSALTKFAYELEKPDSFFCITCNIDKELDMNNIEYMDILIFQLEKLIDKLQDKKVKIDNEIVNSLSEWFQNTIKEINKKNNETIQLENAGSAGFNLLNLFKISTTLRGSITGSAERATSVRQTMKNRFNDFTLKFNEFIEKVIISLKKEDKAKDILFIIDGLEKTMSSDMRKRIIMEESNRLQQINAYTIFTLPIELMQERPKLRQFSQVVSFPFVKIYNRDFTDNVEAIKCFENFIYKRIDQNLFKNHDAVKLAIQKCGGAPRELLRILQYATWNSDHIISIKSVKKVISQLAGEMSQYLTKEKLSKLKEIYNNNQKQIETPFDDLQWEMLENMILLEYNDGTYRRVNPVIEESKIYKQYVTDN